MSPEFACDLCHYKTSRGFAVLNRHKERKHSKRSLQKPLKSDPESDKTPVVIGLKRENDSRPDGAKQGNRVPWVKLQKKEVLANTKYYVCDQCGYKCTSRDTLKGHKKSAICGHRAAAFGHASEPISLKHNENDVDDSNPHGEIQCSKCKGNFSKEYIEYHNKVCGLGPERVKETTALLREETIDNSLKHKCGSCSYVSYSEEELNNHNRSAHEKILAYECNQCEFKSTLRFKLNRHQWKTHGNDIASASFNLWAEQHRKKVAQENPDKPIHDVNRQLRGHWKTLPEAEMKKFVEEAKMSSQVLRNRSLKEEPMDQEELSQKDHNEMSDENDPEWKPEEVATEGKERRRKLSNDKDWQSKKRAHGPKPSRRNNEGKFVCDTVDCGYRTKFLGNMKTHCNRLSHRSSALYPNDLSEHGNYLTTAEILWTKQNKKKVARENMDKPIHEVNRHHHTNWMALPEAEMRKFVEEAKMLQERRNGFMKEKRKEMESIAKVEDKEKFPKAARITAYSEAAKTIFSTSVKSAQNLARGKGTTTTSMSDCEAGAVKPVETKSKYKKIAKEDVNMLNAMPKNELIKEERKEKDEHTKSVGPLDQEDLEPDQNPTLPKNMISSTTQTEIMIIASRSTQTELKIFPQHDDIDISRKSSKEIKAPKDREKCDDCREVNDQNVRLILDLAAAEERLEAERRLRHEIENKLARARKTQFKKEPIEPPEYPDSILGL